MLDHSVEAMIKHYLKAKHGVDYKEETFDRLARTPGAGASGGLVAAVLACFDKAKIVSGMDYVNQCCDLERKIL